MTEIAPAYGLWTLVFINSVIFILFAFSFCKPQSKRDLCSFGAFSAFLVALFTEMYGYPLTIYFLSGWLQSRYPEVNWLAHDAGHLLEMLFGRKANPHFGPFHVLSMVFIGGGFWLLAAAWRILYAAQKTRQLAVNGPYERKRHLIVHSLYPDNVRLSLALADNPPVTHVLSASVHVYATG